MSAIEYAGLALLFIAIASALGFLFSDRGPRG